jgi:hypothetical protein
MIRFAPRASTQIGATPDDPSTRMTWSVAIPSDAKLARVAVP